MHAADVVLQRRFLGGVAETDALEIVALIKTANYPALEAAILKLHAYEVPEILALGGAEGEGRYLEWLANPG